MRATLPALTASPNAADVTVKDAKRYADTHGWRNYNLNQHEPKAKTAKARVTHLRRTGTLRTTATLSSVNMQLQLHQVRYFLALARTLNFTRAAEQCNVTQPALTKAVHKLEQELGGTLIHRERHLTQLTELGKMILPTLEEIFLAGRRSASAGEAIKKKQSISHRGARSRAHRRTALRGAGRDHADLEDQSTPKALPTGSLRCFRWRNQCRTRR